MPTTSDGPTERLILVSNRLPIILSRKDGELVAHAAAGGLATGLSRPHREGGGRWIGWPGMCEADGEIADDVRVELDARGMTGVALTPDEHAAYYVRTSNRCVWPLFHYFTEKVHYDDADWRVYERINRRFADAILAEVQEGDLVFVQDFHLMLVPAMLRAARPGLRIGFFLHIPFPADETFRIFPAREAVLHGLLGADVVAFHTLDYVRHFRTSVRRVLGVETLAESIPWEGREVQLLAQPLGLETATWQVPSTDPDVQREIEELSRAAMGRRLLLGVERLDYTKGIPERLRAFDDLLTAHPEMVDSVMFVQIAVPSRTEAEEYRDLKDEIDRLVGEINGRHGRPGVVPLHYQYRGVPLPVLIALYRQADVALVAPLRDGLNLVAKEYVAARDDDSGVLVLSEFIGAAWELGEALHVNPFDRAELRASLERALAMGPEEQARRMAPMRRRIAENDVHVWTARCLGAIRGAHRRRHPEPLEGEAFEGVIEAWRAARDRAVFLDYDGTLREFEPRPEDASPAPRVLELLSALTRDAGVDLWIVSGRPSYVLDEWLGETGAGLVAEHGAFARPHGERHFAPLLGDPSLTWRPAVRSIFEAFAERVVGSRVEEKPLGIAWHYRAAQPSLATWQARELYQHLSEVLAGENADILQGDKVIEVRPAGVSKAHAMRALLAARDGTPDFVLAAGDDQTDEGLFRAAPPGAVSILVGDRRSAARYRLPDPRSMRGLLEHLSGL
ncbi:MAG: bifunctional alpha,alpha-trehalose-phosphate synthase (UDP-forming)/trehalose-phosphatase [bacterium]|nr:bifunctional alpha,alpha-trehalose-phosphate synthase (UDP-forming)/trehalose-phosphatase [bacterium]